MELNTSFWNGRNVFLTGHTGFKGGWMSLWLQRMNARVYGYALSPPATPNLFDSARISDGMRTSVADVCNLDSLCKSMGEAMPQVAFHFAAQALVRTSYKSPVETFQTNVMGTINFLEAVRVTPSVRVAVIVTSDKCYKNRERLTGYKEDEPLGGDDPYSSSKACAELLTASYRHSFFPDGRVAIATVRAGNVIGGGDWADDRLVPDLVRAFSSGRTVFIRNPFAVRPWQHVLEPLRGYLKLAESLWDTGSVYARGWNFGPRDENAWRVKDVVEHVSKLWGAEAHWNIDSSPQPHEEMNLKLDCTQASSHLGWEPVLGLDAGLQWTIDWYRENLTKNTDMRSFSEKQIENYEYLLRNVPTAGDVGVKSS